MDTTWRNRPNCTGLRVTLSLAPHRRVTPILIKSTFFVKLNFYYAAITNHVPLSSTTTVRKTELPAAREQDRLLRDKVSP